MVFGRIYSMMRHGTDETFSRREVLGMSLVGGAAVEETSREIQGKGDATTVWDILTPHQVSVEISYGEGESSGDSSVDQDSDVQQRDKLNDGNNGVGTPQSYQDFRADLGEFSQGDIKYLHGALESDPGYVEDVDTGSSEGIYFDSTLLEYDRMSREFAKYLDAAEETGNLEEWLANYEEDL